MGDPEALNRTNRFRISQLKWRIPLIIQVLRRRLRLWRSARDTLALRRSIELEQEKLERIWQRLASVRSKRKREKTRKQLAPIEQWLMKRHALIEEFEAEIGREQERFRTISRWLWQGYVDDRDGPSEWILKPRDEA